MAVTEGKGHPISGAKTYTSNENTADFSVTFCLTNPGAPDRHKRHSVLIVEADLPGVNLPKPRDKLGIRAHETAEVRFEDIWVSEEKLIGRGGWVWLLHGVLRQIPGGGHLYNGGP